MMLDISVSIIDQDLEAPSDSWISSQVFYIQIVDMELLPRILKMVFPSGKRLIQRSPGSLSLYKGTPPKRRDHFL